jgi:hypothetical protein
MTMLVEVKNTKEGISSNWYDNNREAYNELRRQRYAKNKDVRDKACQRAARYRKESPIIERKLYRVVKGKKVEVFSTGQVAEMIGRTPQVLRNWERAALIPPSIFPDKHRLYTKPQVAMLVSLAQVTSAGHSWASPEVKTKVRKVKQSW